MIRVYIRPDWSEWLYTVCLILTCSLKTHFYRDMDFDNALCAINLSTIWRETAVKSNFEFAFKVSCTKHHIECVESGKGCYTIHLLVVESASAYPKSSTNPQSKNRSDPHLAHLILSFALSLGRLSYTDARFKMFK